MQRRLAAALAVVAALVLASARPAVGATPSTARRPDPLGRFRSWEEAWAALSPFIRPTTNSALCGSGPTIAAACGDAAISNLWKQWKKLYNKKSDDRYKHFKSNVINIARRLSTCPKALKPYLGNYYMDWSAAELAKHRIKLWVPTIKPGDTIGPKNGPSRGSWDWRATGKVTPAKNQGLCGSCWAFAAAAAIESKLLIQFDKTFQDYGVDLSEQQLVDCANARTNAGYVSRGCNGGNFQDPLFFASRSPVAKEDQHSYESGSTGAAGTCQTTQSSRSTVKDKVQLTGSGFKQLRPWSAAALRQAVQIAPVLVGLYLPEGSLYEFFSDGLWGAANCKLPPGKPNATDAALKINHAVLVVGFNMAQKPPYWIVKNSWGGKDEWGSDGFGTIEMLEDGPGTCYMYYYMVTPTELVPTKLDTIWESAKTSVRLVNRNPANTTAGRLEIKRNGVWGTVCDDRFSNAAATVICRQLDRGTTGIAVPNAYFGEGVDKPLWLDEVGCTGSEARLEQCPHAGWGVTNCGHKEDVGVVCRTEKPVTARLADAITKPGRVSGRLELLYRGSWTPACSSGFDDRAAIVVCKQLRLGTSGQAVDAEVFGPGTGAARLKSISCVGTESKWEACRNAVWGNNGCDAAGSVGVLCTGIETAVRLVNGSPRNTRAMQGRLEIQLQNGSWSTVCDDEFNDVAATVVCRQLGLSSAGFAVGNAAFGEGTGPIAWDGVKCTGSEATIQQCRRSPTIDCTHREDVGVVCGGNDPRVQAPVELQLEGGIGTSGRLMIKYSDKWGSICDDGFTNAAATVACRQLQFSGAGIVVPNTFGSAAAAVPIWLSNVKCLGTEASLADCKHLGWGVSNCQHSEDIAIQCVEAPPRCTPTSCNRGQYCAATGSCTNCDTIGTGRCTACTSATQCTACQPGWTGATCHQQSCKAMGAAGCTTGTIPGTMCCAGQGLSCIIPSGSSSGTCMKAPSLAASPVKSVSAVIASGVVTATVQLAAAPVSGTNGGVITLYKVMLIVPGSSSPLYTLETPVTTTVAYKEGVTTLFGGRKLPARGLCGRTFKVQLAAKNGAGYSGVATSTASYTMPACPAPSIQTTVTCWGRNDLGLNNVPRGLSGVVQVATGGLHTCVLQSTGTVACWGDNDFADTWRVPRGLSGVTQIAAGYAHTCALQSNGRVTCWGLCKDSNRCNVPSSLYGAVQISTTAYHTCALRKGGTVACWGDAGDASAVPSGLSGVVQVSAGTTHTCALKRDGATIICWGLCDNGKCAVPRGLSGVVQVSAGNLHTCALKRGGTITCWGGDYAGQRTVPDGMPAAVQVVAGVSNTCATMKDGTLACWGSEANGPVPNGLSRVIHISLSMRNSCAVSKKEN